ncbi:hypothetical protein PPERSA_10635 [Pseudocohnilembus persalinus]|uniref:RING-type domain-containing protein n=1 Tax=Pseudocohnilembus persalinus TaxID=266149 RepID=A0A0V0QDB8_PSEPJ|nr:hypothetical protein PPERSA_10635 [Pseudocohnilembus persalinus]|eukprot:KRX00136.1 hypothetical protein PPERSA_10635 [Pseudocohnilembus persalinus]
MEAKKEVEECILCFDECEIIGLSQCNHKYMCYKCIYKMRELNQSKICPICNGKNDKTIITSKLDTNFKDYDFNALKLYNQKYGLYVASKECNLAMKQLKAIKCIVPKCSQQSKEFENVNNFKKHLKEGHQRFICDICLQNKKCLLQEHILYTRNQYHRHLNQGDYDEDGVLYAFHPYCVFCDKILYDEDQLTTHMTNHFKCHICDENPEHQFRYYDNYGELEKHYRISHYICEQQNCLENCFIAFKTADELELHNIQIHQVKSGNQALQALTRFGYEGDNDKNKKKNNPFFKDDGAIRDKIGVDFQNQYLSQQKVQMQVAIVDDHQDDIFDFREFYNLKFEDEELDNQEILESSLSVDGYRHNKKGVKKSKHHSDKYNLKEKEDKNRQIYLEDLRFFKYNVNNHLDEQSFNKKLEQVFDQDEWEIYHEKKSLFFKKKISPEQFFKDFIDLCGPTVGYRLFPVFVRTIQNEYTAKELDKLYLHEIGKLPKKHKNMINTQESYSQFLQFFLRELEENIINRIETKRLSLKKRIKMERSRVYQLVEILRRVKTPEMAKLKFLSNFGLSIDGINYIQNKVYFAKLENIQEKIQKIPTQDILKLYMYINICNDLLTGKLQRKEKKYLSTLVLKGFFQKYPHIVEKYCKKYRTNISDASSDEENQQKKHAFYKGIEKQFEEKKQLDFPELYKKTPQEIEQERKKQEEEKQKEIERLEKEQKEKEALELKIQEARIKEQESKYHQAVKNKKWQKEKYQEDLLKQDQQNQEKEEEIKYQVEYKKNKEIKERRVFLDSEDEQETKAKKSQDIEKQELKKKQNNNNNQQQQKKKSDEIIDKEQAASKNEEWWEGNMEKGGYDKDLEKIASQQKNKQQEKDNDNGLIKYEGSDIDEDEEQEFEKKQRTGNQWGLTQKTDKQKISYTHSNVQQRIKSEIKNEDYFPSLGGSEPNKNTGRDLLAEVSKPQPKKQQQQNKQSNQNNNNFIGSRFVPGNQKQKNKSEYKIYAQDQDSESEEEQVEEKPKKSQNQKNQKNFHQDPEEQYPSLEPQTEKNLPKQQNQQYQKKPQKVDSDSEDQEEYKPKKQKYRKKKGNYNNNNNNNNNQQGDFPGLGGDNYYEEKNSQSKQQQQQQYSNNWDEGYNKNNDAALKVIGQDQKKGKFRQKIVGGFR